MKAADKKWRSLSLIHLDTQVNVRKNLNIQYPVSESAMEFDIWIPEHNICFEFQVSFELIVDVVVILIFLVGFLSLRNSMV